MEVTEGKASEEQGQLEKGRGCVDQIFGVKIMVDEYLEKDENVWSLHGPKKKHMRVDRETEKHYKNLWCGKAVTGRN